MTKFATITIIALVSFLSSTIANAQAATLPTPSDDLGIGSRGSDVVALQQILVDEGYLTLSPSGYFGSATQAALAHWQKENSISPASGYFGPKSRAALKTLLTTASPSMAAITPATSTTTAAPDISAALSNQTIPETALISDADAATARASVLAIDLTASAESDITIQEMKFHTAGVVSNNAIAGAYLVQDGQVIATYDSIAHGVIEFSGIDWVIPAGQTQTIWLAIDLADGLSPGDTIGFSLDASSDILATDATGTVVVVNGAFPMNGAVFPITSVSNPSLANLSITPLSVGTSITVGMTNNLVASWNFTIGNDDAVLEGLKLTQQGAADPSSLQNLKLFINGTQIGTTTPVLDGSGAIFFDFSNQPVNLNNGSNLVQLFADVTGSPGDDIQFEIFNPYDVFVVDKSYDAPIAGQADPGTDISIPAGTLIITPAR